MQVAVLWLWLWFWWWCCCGAVLPKLCRFVSRYCSNFVYFLCNFVTLYIYIDSLFRMMCEFVCKLQPKQHTTTTTTTRTTKQQCAHKFTPILGGKRSNYTYSDAKVRTITTVVRIITRCGCYCTTLLLQMRLHHTSRPFHVVSADV